MTKIVLMYGHQNPKGRGLVQRGDELFVLSECCEGEINALSRKENGETWLVCIECDRYLQQNVRMWNCHIQRLSPDAGREAWGDWGRDLFGLNDLVVSVEFPK